MLFPFLLAAGAFSLVGLGLGRRKRRRSSSGTGAAVYASAFDTKTDSWSEDMPDVMASEEPTVDGRGVVVDIDDETWLVVGDSLGWGYKWAGGSPSTPWKDGKKGTDCGGWLQMALVKLGLLPADAPDRSIIDLANVADAVPVGFQRPGDFAVYRRRHGMLVVSHPRADLGGHSHVMGQSGGDQETQGVDPSAPGYSANARVKVYAKGPYRDDFLTYARLR